MDEDLVGSAGTVATGINGCDVVVPTDARVDNEGIELASPPESVVVHQESVSTPRYWMKMELDGLKIYQGDAASVAFDVSRVTTVPYGSILVRKSEGQRGGEEQGEEHGGDPRVETPCPPAPNPVEELLMSVGMEVKPAVKIPNGTDSWPDPSVLRLLVEANLLLPKGDAKTLVEGCMRKLHKMYVEMEEWNYFEHVKKWQEEIGASELV